MKHIILVSSSPRRRELLKILGLKFTAIAADYEEKMNIKLPPLELAKFLSAGKAKSAIKKYPKHLIIAADTFVAYKNELLGKPCDKSEAFRMLKKISGKTLSVITGYTIIDATSGKRLSKAVESKITLKRLSDAEINNYIKTKEPLDKAGAFAVQGLGSIFIKKIEGDFLGVVGLPLFGLSQSLKKFGIKIL